MAALCHDIAGLRQFIFRQARQSVLAGAQMDLDDDTEIVQQSGDRGPGNNIGIRHADHFRHDEGSSAHNGRQQLSADGSGRFHRAGKLFGITGLFH